MGNVLRSAWVRLDCPFINSLYVLFFGKSSKREIHKMLSYGRRIAIAQLKDADHEIFWVRRFEKRKRKQQAMASRRLLF